MRNAEQFVREQVDVVIEFQVEQHAAPIIADKIAAANIPLIAVDIPHPHSTYFGMDNYRAGFEAGSLLADYALNRWEGKVDWMLGLDLEEAGLLVQSRITGAIEAVKTRLANVPVETFVRIDGRGLTSASYNSTRILIAAANDSSALGAIQALRELDRERHAAVVGQDALDEMVQELHRVGTPAIGSVSHEVSKYGPRLIDLGLALLRGEKVAPYNYVEHKLIMTPHLHRRERTSKPRKTANGAEAAVENAPVAKTQESVAPVVAAEPAARKRRAGRPAGSKTKLGAGRTKSGAASEAAGL